MNPDHQRKKNVSISPARVYRGKKTIRVCCELAGIPEEKIRIDLEKKRLSISAVTGDGDLVRKIRVPDGAWISRKEFRDGQLEIELMRPE